MPKRVDHAVRRAEITDALLRVAARRGLHAVGMRDVAAEAGVSLRLVQYYFETKEKLLLHGLERLTARFGQRVAERVRGAGDPPGPRA
ncbi:TetR/AcrR family transcriptional regulator, partial [Streptomyces sp. NPDC002454]